MPDSKKKSAAFDDSMDLDESDINDGDEDIPDDELGSSSSDDDDVRGDPDGDSEIPHNTSGKTNTKRRNPISSEDNLDASLKKAARLNKARLEIKQEVSFKK